MFSVCILPLITAFFFFVFFVLFFFSSFLSDLRKLTLFPLKCNFSDPKRRQRCALPSLKKSTPSHHSIFFFVQASVPSRLASTLPPPPSGNKCIAQYDICSLHTTRLSRYAHFRFSSPELKAHWWAYRIGRHLLSVVRLSTFSNIFSSEATGPIETKFYVEALWVGWTKVPSNGHVTWPRCHHTHI